MSHEIAPQASAFASLAELRAVQARLGERRRQDAESTALWDAVEDFVRRGAATGIVLDSEEDRWSVQGLLDYWAAALERAGRPRGDSSLVEFDPELAPELPDTACPYLGLSAFQETNSHMFFGRDALVDKLVHHLGAHRLVALVGPSGCGKSSLAFAGLLRRLRDGALPRSEAWHVLSPMVPGAAPRAALASRLEEYARGRDARDPSSAALVLVIDQFEELFTMCESEVERAWFVNDLLALVTSPSPPHRLVLTVRSDFESFVARHPALYERYDAGRVAVTPPSAAELRQAIEGPAALVGLKFEVGVIDRLLQELLGEPAGLPLLQFTLLRLWEERRRNRVTTDCYERVGGGRQALARTADAIYDAMIHEDQATARRIFLLVGLAIDDKHELTRTRVPRSRFFEHGDDPGRIERVLDRLIQAQLLRQTVSPQGAEPQVEVAHEALVRNWPLLTEWLQEAQTSLAQRRRLEARAKEWIQLDRDPRALLDEVELREAERWLDSAAGIGLRASGDLLALITSSRQRMESNVRQRVASAVRRHRWTIAGLVAVATVLLAMLVITVRQNRVAQDAQLATSHFLGTANLEQGRDLLLDGSLARPMRALPYFVAARTAGIETPTLRMLFAQASRSIPLVTLIGHSASVSQAAFSPDGTRVITASDDQTARVWDVVTGKPAFDPIRHQGPVTAAAFSPNGTRVVTASKSQARVWDARTGQPVTDPLKHQSTVTAAAFSPDGTRVVTASEDKTARVWDARTGQPVTDPLKHQSTVTAAAFSPDGTRVVTASENGTAYVWDARTGQLVTGPLVHSGPVNVAAFSPDGTQVVTASKDQTARVWDARTGQLMTDPLIHQGPVNVAAFSPDGTQVVTASKDQTARVWNPSTGTPVTARLEHQSPVNVAAFSPDGTRVVTASEDHTARVWDASTGTPVTALLEHQNTVKTAAFSPDGTRVVTASSDGTARIWAVRAGERLTILLNDYPGRDDTQNRDARTTAAFSPDGTRVIAASGDNTARVWDARTGQPVTAPLVHQGPVNVVAFSPDGTRVITASGDNTARVWDARTGQPVTAPLKHQREVASAAFSQDSARVVTGSKDQTWRVWDARTGQPVTNPPVTDPLKHQHPVAHQAPVVLAAFSPDGTQVITASEDNTARVWDATTGQLVWTNPLVHQGPVNVAAFSPDGLLVVTASYDKTARVWDPRTGQPVTEPLAHQGPVNVAAFSPDGLLVVTASEDHTAQVWDARTGQPVTAPLEHQDAVNVAAFSPDGSLVVTGSSDRTARVWDARTGQPVTAPLKHVAPLTVAAFSPDGTRVITGSGYYRFWVWDLPVDNGSLDDWRLIARCSPFALSDGVLTTNSEPLPLCQHY